MVEITTFSPKPVTDKLDETNAKLDTANTKLDTANAKLDTLLSKIDMEQYLKIRYGRLLTSIKWIYGGHIIAPEANRKLVQYTVPSGRQAYIYGYYISATEGNMFILEWTSDTKYTAIRVIFGGGGTVVYTDLTPINEGLPATEGQIIGIYIKNAGSAGSGYQAGLLIGEI